MSCHFNFIFKSSNYLFVKLSMSLSNVRIYTHAIWTANIYNLKKYLHSLFINIHEHTHMHTHMHIHMHTCILKLLSNIIYAYLTCAQRTHKTHKTHLYFFNLENNEYESAIVVMNTTNKIDTLHDDYELWRVKMLRLFNRQNSRPVYERCGFDPHLGMV